MNRDRIVTDRDTGEEFNLAINNDIDCTGCCFNHGDDDSRCYRPDEIEDGLCNGIYTKVN